MLVDIHHTQDHLVDEQQVHQYNRIKNRTDLKKMMTYFGSTRSFRRKSRSSVKQQTKSPSDYAATPHHPSSLEVSDSSPHYMKETSCSEGKRGHFQASTPHSFESSFESSDQSWSPSSWKSSSTLSRTSSGRTLKIMINRTSTKSKRSSSNCQQVPVKSTCSSTLKDTKFPQHVELHPGQSESGRISKVKVCSYHHCSLNKCCDDSSPPVKRVYRRRKLVKSQKSIRLESESTNADSTSLDAEVHKVNEVIEYADIVFGETSFPERSYQETMDIMRKYSILEQDTLVATSKCCNNMEREWDESTYVSDDLESNDQCVTTSDSCNDEDRDPDSYHTISLPLPIKPGDNVTTAEDEIINRELSKNETFAIKQISVSDDFIEAKCSTKFSSASACNSAMELEQNLQEKDDKATSNEDLDSPSCPIGDSESRNYTPTENAEPSASAKNLHVARLPKGKHRSMWTLIHRHMISDESTEWDSKVTCGADEENHKFCAAESSYSLLKFSERESMTTNQDADNQGVEARKFLAIMLVREAIERILLPEVQDQSSDNQSVTSKVCTKENFKESNTKNESDEGSITGENIGSPDKQKTEGQVTNEGYIIFQ